MSKKIAVCDSGVGGLFVLNELVKNFPSFDYLYFSDRKNLPYGNKNKDQIESYCKRFCVQAEEHGADVLIVACNTMATVGEKIFKNNKKTPIIFIRPSLWKILEGDINSTKILCTVATSKSVQLRALNNAFPGCVIPFLTLANQIENNLFNLEKIGLENLVKSVGYPKRIFLACTHYISLIPFFKSVYPKTQIYTGMENTINLLRILNKSGKKTPVGSIRFFDSENETLKSVYHSFFNSQNKL